MAEYYYVRTNDRPLTKLPPVVDIQPEDLIYLVRKINGKYTSNQAKLEDLAKVIKGSGGGMLIGHGDPDPTLGDVDNTYFDVDNNNLWQKTDTGWTVVGNLKGEHGEDGVMGTGLVVLGTLPGPEDLPQENNSAGDTYIANKTMYVWDSLKWSEVGQQGPRGESNYAIAVRNGYEGTEAEWLETQKIKGDKGDQGPIGPIGMAIKILGRFDFVEELPEEGTNEGGYVVDNDFYAWDGFRWVNLGNIQGPQGDEGKKGDPGNPGTNGTNGQDIYELAKEHGFIGTEQQYLDSLRGPQGHGMTLKGTLADRNDLPTEDNIPGDAYLVNELNADNEIVGNVYGWDGTQWLNFGPYRGPKGEKGDKGDRGIQGIQGPMGKPIQLKGTFTDTQDLPMPAEIGDAYMVGENIFIYNGTDYVDYGKLRGEAGTSIVPKGSVYSKDYLPGYAENGWFYNIQRYGYIYFNGVWVNMGYLGGEKGESALEIAQKHNPNIKDENDFLNALIGPMGESLKAKGELPSMAELNAIRNPTLGDAYMVVTSLYVWDGNDWIYMGDLKGDKGDQGIRGEKGEMGAGITIKGRRDDPSQLPANGQEGEGYLIGLDLWAWTGAKFENLGEVKGPKGDEGPQGPEGKQGVRGIQGIQGEVGTLWLVFPRDPNAIDGRKGDYFINSVTMEYFRKSTAVLWVSMGHMGGGNVYDANYDGKTKGRLNGNWVNVPEEAPKDAGYYVRVDGRWQQLDRYDLLVMSTTGVIDVMRAQIVTVDANADRIIDLQNLPAGRAMVIGIKLLGNRGIVKWKQRISWNQGFSPTLGGTSTLIVIFWDGSTLTGNTSITIM